MILKQGLETLLKKKVEIEKLLAGPGRYENARPGLKPSILERSDLEKLLIEIEAEIEVRREFKKRFKEGVPITHPMHFYWANKDMIENVRKRPQRQRAARKSANKRQKKSASWKEKFLEHYHSPRFKQKFDIKKSDAKIIAIFIAKNNKAPRTVRTYYNYLKSVK